MKKEFKESGFGGTYTQYLEHKLKYFRNPVTFERILMLVCFHFDVMPDEVLTKSRRDPIIRPRQVVQYLADKHTVLGRERIGEKTKCDRSTVAHSCMILAQDMKLDEPLNRAVLSIEKTLRE